MKWTYEGDLKILKERINIKLAYKGKSWISMSWYPHCCTKSKWCEIWVTFRMFFFGSEEFGGDQARLFMKLRSWYWRDNMVFSTEKLF